MNIRKIILRMIFCALCVLITHPVNADQATPVPKGNQGYVIGQPPADTAANTPDQTPATSNTSADNFNLFKFIKHVDDWIQVNLW